MQTNSKHELFLEQALNERMRGLPAEGAVLRVDPNWVHWTYWLFTGAAAAFLVFVLAARTYQYSAGPAVVRVEEGRTLLASRLSGTIAEVTVEPGKRVRENAPLVRLYDGAELAELEGLNREHDLQLLRLLRDPADGEARSALTRLHAQREAASARQRERCVRAPHDGVVRDLRARIGQHVQPGDALLTLVGDNAAYQLVAMVPGQDRPRLRPGMALRFEVKGYPYAFQELIVESVGDEALGPAEVQRYLGPQISDTVNIVGSTVLVTARLPGSFTARKARYRYYDGMLGNAKVRLDSRPLASTLLPAIDLATR